MIKSGIILSVGNISAALLSLVRNILIARLISVEDFGIASALAIAMSLVEMTSNIALDRLIVQARDGDTEGLQKSVQLLQAIRGLIAGLILFLFAGWIASLFGVPHAAWAFEVLSLLPVLRGVSHFDMFRMQREMKFSPSIVVELSSQIISTAVALLLAILLGDFRAMLFALLVQQVVYTLVSHGVAIRSYRWSWSSTIVNRAISFGWPILLNNVLMFGLFNGELMIVGSQHGTVELGWFAAIFNLTLVASIVVARTLQSFLLPLLSQAQDELASFQNLAIVSAQAGLLACAISTVCWATVGPALFITLYGVKYEPALSVLVLLAIMQGIRTARVGPVVAAMAKAETRIPLLATIARIAFLPAAWYLASNSAGIDVIVGLAIMGETLAFATSVFLLSKWLQVPVFPLIPAIFTCAITLVLVGIDNMLYADNSIELRYEQILLIFAVLLVIWSMPALRGWLKSTYQISRSRFGQ